CPNTFRKSFRKSSVARRTGPGSSALSTIVTELSITTPVFCAPAAGSAASTHTATEAISAMKEKRTEPGNNMISPQKVLDISLFPVPCPLEHPLNPPIRHQPYKRHNNINRLRSPAVSKGQRNRHSIEQPRQRSLAILSDRFRQNRLLSFNSDQRVRKDPIRYTGHHQDPAVHRCGKRTEVVLTHPAGHRRQQR